MSDEIVSRMARVLAQMAKHLHRDYHQVNGYTTPRPDWKTCNLGYCGEVNPLLQEAATRSSAAAGGQRP